MKFFCSVLTLMLLTGVASPAFAQDSMNEFTAQKSKDGAAEGSEKEDAASSAENPLGAAANLPVSGEVSVDPAFGAVPQTPEELQAQMEAEAEEQKQKLKEETYRAAIEQLMPMTPEDTRNLLETFRNAREAAETPIRVPEAKVEVQSISLDPSQMPPSILLAPGYVTTVSVLDSTGSPWPIVDVSWGGKFDVVAPADKGGHIVRVTPLTAHGDGNLSIRLADLITPVTFKLKTSLDVVHFRYDARIPKAGPLAKTPIIQYGGLNAVAGADESLTQVLDGTPPPDAEKIKMNGVDGRTSAWRVNGQVYLRTPLTLLSPTWDASVTSADGVNVYMLGNAPVILLSDEGRMVRAYIADEGVNP